MDASCVLFQPITGWLADDGDWDLQGFAAPFDDDGVSFENWAFAAPQASRMVAEWFAEYDRAVAAGIDAYCQRLVAAHPPVLPPGLRDGDLLPYLAQHAAFHVARRRLPLARVRMLPSWEGPYALHVALNWDVSAVVHAVATWSNVESFVGCFCKIRGAERALLPRRFHRRSAVARQLGIETTWFYVSWSNRTIAAVVLLLLVVVVIVVSKPKDG